MHTAAMMMVCAVTASVDFPIDSLLEAASRGYEDLSTVAERQAAFDAKKQLAAIVRNTADETWPAIRDRLLEGLDDENLGVWDSCAHALVIREPDLVAETLSQHLTEGRMCERDAARVQVIGQIGPRLSPANQAMVAQVFFDVIQDRGRPKDCSAVIVSIGRMGPAGFEYLQQIVADEYLRPIVNSQLPYAYSQTCDERAFAVLDEFLLSSTPDGNRVGCLSSMGTLVKCVGHASEAAQEMLDRLRFQLLDSESDEVAAVAAVALSRAGRLLDPETINRVFELVDRPSSRKNALRAILQSGVSLEPHQKATIKQLANDAGEPLAVRKLASAVLAVGVDRE